MAFSVGTQRVNQPVGEMGSGGIVFPFGRRYALCILIAILCSEYAKIDMACGCLSEIRFLSGNLRCWQVLEDKRHKKLAQQCVCTDIVAKLPTFPFKLPLDTADKKQ